MVKRFRCCADLDVVQERSSHFHPPSLFLSLSPEHVVTDLLGPEGNTFRKDHSCHAPFTP